jgi:hypothetical protein
MASAGRAESPKKSPSHASTAAPVRRERRDEPVDTRDLESMENLPYELNIVEKPKFGL